MRGQTLSIFSLRNSEHIPDTQCGFVLRHFSYHTVFFIADSMFLIIIDQLQFWSFIDKNA